MQDIQLYEQLLGLQAPWKVEAVKLKVAEEEIEVRVECQETMWGCPVCSERMHIHEWEERRWRHLDSCQFKTIIVARVPRVRCDQHGSQVVAVPWAEKFGRFTRLFERLAIQVLLICSVAEACRLLRISWEEADGIKHRAVDRGLACKPARQLKRLCVDEKTAGWGQEYVTVVAQVNEEQTVVEYVGDGREEASLDAFWQGLTGDQLAAVEAVAMDMWEPYYQSTMRHEAIRADRCVLPQSTLGKAVRYLLNEYTALVGYLRDGRFEIDSNLVENDVRPSAVGKKRWLFIGHPDAGWRSAVIYTLIQSCRRYGINPQEYLIDVLGRLPSMTTNQVRDILPAQWRRARQARGVEAQ